MTAEIAIMNQHGISLAADSAVTIDNNRREKIYNSANKLFMLSKYRPVGIMVYGNAALNGIPWEIIIKDFRKCLKDSKFDSLEEYAEKFICFVRDEIFPLADRVIWFDRQCSELVLYVRGKIDDEVQLEIKNNPGMNLAALESICSNACIASVQFIFDRKDLGFSDEIIKMRTPEIYDKCNKISDDILENRPISGEARKVLIESMILWFNKDSFVPESGIVIAGFGEKNFSPVLCDYSCEGVIPGIFKYRLNNNYKITPNNNSLIVPFAQKDAVWTFTKGIDPELEATIGKSLNVMLSQEYPNSVLKILNDSGITCDQAALKIALSELGNGCFKGITDKVDEYKLEKFIRPLVNTVTMLPLEEMASMAETFVNLSSIKKKFTLQSETVGGPIDVCVISKSDGFIWIKRKHYFEQKLNSHFFQNYYRE